MVADIFAVAYYVFIMFGIFVTVTGKGHGSIWAIVATVLSGFVSPLAGLIICLLFVPVKKGSYWDGGKK